MDKIEERKWWLQTRIRGLEWDLAQMISWSRNRADDKKAIGALEKALADVKAELEALNANPEANP